MRLRVWSSLVFSCIMAGAPIALSAQRTDVPMAVSAQSADLPDAAALRAKVTAAMRPPPNYRAVITGHGTDGDVGEIDYHLNDSTRRVFGSDAVRIERGSFHGETWLRDENGVTVVDDDPPGEPRTLTLTRTTSPETFVLSDLTKAGYGTRTVVDPATDTVLRVDDISPIRTETTTYTAYKNVGSATLPSTWTITTNGPLKPSSMSYTLGDVVVGGVTASDVAEPQTPDLVTFPAGATHVTLPTTFVADGHILVDANVAGQPFKFVLDSGSSAILISPSLAKRLGLKLFNQATQHAAGSFAAAEAVVPELHIGPLVMHNVVVEVAPGVTFDQQDAGLLGFDFFATLAVQINYVQRHVSVSSGWDFNEPPDTSAFPVDIRLGNLIPMVSTTVNDNALADRIIVDTGGGGTLMLFDYFSRAHPQVYDTPEFSDVMFSGLGGGISTTQFRFRSIKVGHLKLENFDGYRVVGKQSYPYAADGLFGINFLEHFNVDFDYVHAQMVLRVNHDGGLRTVR